MYPSSWGSLRDMAKHLHRLECLSVDYVWLSPCFQSPWDDGGYDVSDYLQIDPRFGTLEDFDFFVAEAKRHHIGVLMDLVMNHTSTRHEWFQRSRACDPQYRDYYIWRDEDLGWKNNFNGESAFLWDEKRRQYYLHLFCDTQADLNWQNPAVLEEFQKIIDFWTLEHGVAGFRLDVAQYLSKDLTKSQIPGCFGVARGFLKYWQKPETVEILHRLFDGRDLFVFSESGFISKRQFREMAGPSGPLSAALNVVTYNGPAGNSFGLFRALTHHWSHEPGFIACAESHDAPRSTSRYHRPGEEVARELFRPSTSIACLYQGQELGLTNPILPDTIDGYQDIQTIMRYDRMVNRGISPRKAISKLRDGSRDNARRPIDLEQYRFQELDLDSCLTTVKRLIKKWRAAAPH